MTVIKKHQIFTFYFATILLTGILFATQMMVFPKFPLPLFLLSPGVIALLMVIFVDKRDDFRQMFKRTKIIPVVMAIIWPIIIVSVSKLTLILIKGDSLSSVEFGSLGLGVTLAIIIGCIGEEIGWRGYLLPVLVEKYNNKTVASIIVGILWGFWHIGDYGEGLGFIFFVFSTIGLSIIMTWLYYKGKQSIYTAIIVHSVYNISGVFLAVVPSSGVASLTYRIISAVIPGVIGIYLIMKSPIFRKQGTIGPEK